MNVSYEAIGFVDMNLSALDVIFTSFFFFSFWWLFCT